jgi:enoyl-CoA hydratase/carnithine racemase
MTNVLKVEKYGRVTVMTLNRPERHNALNMALGDALKVAVTEFSNDKEQRVMVITGTGEKAFCSGGDLLEMRGGVIPAVTAEQDLCGLEKCDKPVICAINGLAVGGGLELALCCDFRLASDTAWFGLPEVERGFLPGVASVTLPRMIPIGAVMELLLLGERMSVADAYRLGLVQKVLAPDKLMAEALRCAERMSSFSPAAMWGAKQVMRYWRNMGMDEHHRFYQGVVRRVIDSGDVIEGLAAFAEKRKPEY